MSDNRCGYCQAELVQPRYGRRKWCNDRCRRQATYAGTCQDCGAELNGSHGRGKARPKRCMPCANARTARERRRAFDVRLQRMVEMREAGLLNVEIAERLRTTKSAVAMTFVHAKRRGIVVPPAPYRTPGHARAGQPR